MAWFVLAPLAILAVAGAVYFRPATSPSLGHTLRFTPFSFDQGGSQTPVWSPDGKAVAVALLHRGEDGYRSLWISAPPGGVVAPRRLDPVFGSRREARLA
jgi:hypothetical protein